MVLSMTNLNDFTANRNAKAVLGTNVTVTVNSTFNLYNGKRRAGVLNVGKVTDGEFAGKVFVVGLDEPASEFCGQVIAIAHDNDGEQEDVWIASPEGSIFYEPKLVALLGKYLPGEKYNYICLYEKSCGAVMYTISEGVRKYILITNISGHIGFPKGHVEKGENERQTALREIYEETGIHTDIIDGFRETYNYLINGFIRKKAVYFLAPFDESNIRMNIREISEYRLLTFDEAYKTLNFRHDKDILEKADKFVNTL